MTESSRYWNTNDVGDGNSSGYSRTAIAAWLAALFGRGISGVLNIAMNEMAVSGSSSPLAVASGAAIVDGIFYSNDASLNLNVTTPSIGTTGGRVILRADWTAQTVRAAILMSADGTASLPALTQTPGTTYEISLASFTITTAGAITLTDARDFTTLSHSLIASHILMAARSVLGNSTSSAGDGEEITPASDGLVLLRNGSALEFGQVATAGIADDAITVDKLAPDLEVIEAQIANGAVELPQLETNAVDDTKAGSRVPQFYRRQGGSASIWNSPGVTDYTPGAVRMACGSYQATINNGSSVSGEWTITLPFAFSNYALAYASIASTATEPIVVFVRTLLNTSTLGITLRRSGTSGSLTVNVHWLVIGPE